VSLHLCPIEPADWTDTPEYDDPLENVEHPRERKPWKRDRHAIRWQMQRAMNLREWATYHDFGNGRQFPTSLMAQSAAANRAQFEVRRALLKVDDLGRMHEASRREHLARLRRYVLKARELRLAAMTPPPHLTDLENEDG
jgi:hypothetical protein